ncbi:Crp/Fnr family transcriptional regulator [Maritimibacter sp. UBA3975]|uniref:Crp/Fnr family transcriptional regulator n=1 Tax=Maritimibacter sp. UBA3975 TaxID=1946833 RepID=UPI0025B8678B|nr:Crp/Fnr family transcriptional regulator [Maritimibacter sp. UBA3975]|tara:strand:+ start:114199 stop:114786 length:588 start_codon:yes stop_codon:yes gene_type:complete
MIAPPTGASFGAPAVTEFHLSKGTMRSCEDLTTHFAIVRFGALKVEFLNIDGHPETAGFLFPGEPLVCSVSDQDVAITALEDTSVCDVRPGLLSLDDPQRAEAVELFSQAIAEQAGQDQRRLIQARSGAVSDRLLWFIKDLSSRQKSRTVTFAMSRSDMSHYLNTSAESVSRTLTFLRKKGTIERISTRMYRLAS